MLPPEDDRADRTVVWDAMQMFWMDVETDVDHIAAVCAASKYELPELEQIFWTEVRPAMPLYFWPIPAPEWTGFEITWLTNRILARHRFGRRLPMRWCRRDSSACWRQLATRVSRLRGARSTAP